MRVRPWALIATMGVGALIGGVQRGSMYPSAVLAGCNGCRPGQGGATEPASSAAPPTLRLYVLSNAAGELEPCGCQPQMLGGVDRFGALVAAERATAPSMVVAVGPTFFAHLPAREREVTLTTTEQELWKASALARGLRETGLVAWTPGANDWLAGAARVRALREESGAPLLAANVGGSQTSDAGATVAIASTTRSIAGVQVGFVGVSVPDRDLSAALGDDTKAADPTPILAAEARRLRTAGARIVVGLAAVDRGAGLRLATAVPELDVLALGLPSSNAEENDTPRAPQLVGPVLVVQPSNHLTRTSVVEFTVRDAGRFADGTGIQGSAEVAELDAQIADLRKRMAFWEADKAVSKADLARQKERLADLEKRRAHVATPVEPKGSFFRYRLVEIRESLGQEPTVASAMAAYYQNVNAFNRNRYRDLHPAAPEAGAPWYAGAETCRGCHSAAFDVWQRTGHGHAYATLSRQSKEFNLDCVSCHVTGYERAGGSTVTDLGPPDLRDVQCESCHGPGSQHATDPAGHRLASPSADTCRSCHHPPHTDVFDFAQRLPHILGPGHGMPGAPKVGPAPSGWTAPSQRYAVRPAPSSSR